MEEQYLQAMTIAGSDSDGSAGMQADMHTFFTRSVYGVSVMTACVAGNSYGIGRSQDQIAMEAQGCKQICIHSLQEVFTVFLS